MMGEPELQRIEYIAAPTYDPISEFAYKYYDYDSYGGITYGKTASVLFTLEHMIGEDTMLRAMHAYFIKYRFTHPTEDDFLKTIEEVSGRSDLKQYFDQAMGGTQVLDYEVSRVDSFPVNWYKDQKKMKDDDKNTVYQDTVWLHRKGDFILPVVVEINFTDGSKVRENWDGRDRWTKFAYEKKAKVVSAEIDPDHLIFIDRDNFDRSRRAEPDLKAGLKVSNYWIFVTEWASQALAWWGV
jgi:Peptidase family M1 domain